MRGYSITLDGLEERIKKNDGVLTVRMHQVRDACGVQRLREQTLERIKEKLQLKGIAHTRLSLDKDDEVRLYLPATPVGRFIKAAFKPSSANDDKLRELAQQNAAETVQKIRDLLA